MKKIFLLIAAALLLGPAAGAQGVLNVRINEVLTVNENDIVDAYGGRESWIELFNTGYEKVDLGGCYLGVRYAGRFDADGNKLIRKYYIPRNDPATAMEPLGYRVFFCDGTDTKGTFYTNFTLENEGVDMVILYNANGRDVISVFRFPEGYAAEADVALGILGHEEIESKIFPSFSAAERRRMSDDEYLDALADGLKYVPTVMVKTTPGVTNEVTEDVARHEQFRRRDPSGAVMAVTAMGVVFLALITIFLVFKAFGKIMVGRANRKESLSTGEPMPQRPTRQTSYSGEEVAVIALALKLYRADLHDRESDVITINRVGRIYSPWNSKLYGMTVLPDRKN